MDTGKHHDNVIRFPMERVRRGSDGQDDLYEIPPFLSHFGFMARPGLRNVDTSKDKRATVKTWVHKDYHALLIECADLDGRTLTNLLTMIMGDWLERVGRPTLEAEKARRAEHS